MLTAFCVLGNGRLFEASKTNHTTLVFQRPRRKTKPLTTARVEKAIVIAMKTPRGPMPNLIAST